MKAFNKRKYMFCNRMQIKLQVFGKYFIAKKMIGKLILYITYFWRKHIMFLIEINVVLNAHLYNSGDLSCSTKVGHEEKSLSCVNSF